jgi:hypothetical protein
VIPEIAHDFISDEIEALIIRTPESSTGVCSLAAGADQIFANAIVRLGRSLHVVVPAEGYTATFGDPADREDFDRLVSAATVVEVLHYDTPTEEAFLAAGKRVVDLCEVLVAVWDGKEARGLGGTADIVDYARALDREVRIIWPDSVER